MRLKSALLFTSKKNTILYLITRDFLKISGYRITLKLQKSDVTRSYHSLPTVIQKQPPDLFYKKGVLKNFAKFTGTHLCLSLFLVKPLKKETLAQVFSCEFCEIFKSTFFTEHLRATASDDSQFTNWYMITLRIYYIV